MQRNYGGESEQQGGRRVNPRLDLRGRDEDEVEDSNRTLRDARMLGPFVEGEDDFDRWIRLLFHSYQMLYGTVFLETTQWVAF